MPPSANEIAAQYERREREKSMAAHPSNSQPRRGDVTIWHDGDMTVPPSYESSNVTVQINGNVLVVSGRNSKEILVLKPGAHVYFEFSDEGE